MPALVALSRLVVVWRRVAASFIVEVFVGCLSIATVVG